MPLTRPRTALLSDVDGFLNYTGMIKPHSGAASPSAGWLLCDGTSYLRATYPNLFALIGTAFGSVDGTHFSVPDMRGRTPIGSGQGTYVVSFLNTAITIGGSGTITVPNNAHFIAGQVIQFNNNGETVPGGLSFATNYWITNIVVAGTTTFQLANSLAQAQSNVANITISSQGTGTHIIAFQNFTTRAIGITGGEEAHAMSSTELLSHSHAGTPPSTVAAATGAGTLGVGGSPVTTGGNAAMNLLQPFLTLNWIIKV